MSGLFSQVGFADEGTYNTAVAVSRFYEFTKEGIEGKYERIESKALRSGTRVLRSDRFQVNPKGANGSIEFEVLNKGFGYFLKHMLGTVTTTGAGPYTHTGTVSDLTGKFFTTQVGRTKVGTISPDPYTYSGGKVANWTIMNATDGILMLNLGLDFATETFTGSGAFALQAASYPATAELFTFTGGTIQIAGTSVEVNDVSFKGENGLSLDRYFIRSSAVKKEPIEKEMRKYMFDLTLDYLSTAQYARVASATAAGALATISATWTSPTGSVLAVTAPAARFDNGTPNVESADLLNQKLGGMLLDPGTGASPITIAYTTPDVTP